MRQGVVYLNKERVGIITELSSNEYKFRYDDEYFNDPSKPSISLTLTKQQQEYTSHYLFPFFVQHAVRRAQPHRSGKIIAD